MSVTRHHERVGRVIHAVVAGLLISLLGLATASCSGGGASGPQKVVEIVVPAGTQDKLNRGELVDVMPAELYFRVGDVIRIRNDDSVDQYAGPYLVQAGQQFELKFGAPGKYGGLCNLSGGSTYMIVITE